MSRVAVQRFAFPTFTVLIAAAFFVASARVPVELTPTGGRTLEGWGLAMVGLALLASGVVSVAGWGRAAFWIAVLVLGSAAQLALTRPHWAMSLRVAWGPIVDRPEYAVAGAMVAAQASMVLLAALTRVRRLTRLALAEITIPRAAAALVIFMFCAENLAVEYPAVFEGGYRTEIYVRRLVLAALILVVNVLNLWLVGRAIPSRPLERLRAWVEQRLTLPGQMGTARSWDGSFPWVLAGGVLLLTLFITFAVLDAAPHISDEAVFLWVARVYAGGSLGVPAPPVPESFEMFTVVVRDGLRYGVTHLGWPLALTPAVLLGVPWLLNPLLGAASIVAGHTLVRRLADRGTAHVVAVFLALSPWFLILSSVYQPHALSLFAALCAWLAMDVARVDGRRLAAFAAGLAAGVVFTLRPMDGVIVGASAFIYAVAPLGRGEPRWKALPTYVAGCIATGSIVLVLNYLLTGSPLSFPIMEYLDDLWGPGSNRLGFGPEVGQVWGVLDPIPGHGWRDVLLNLNQNLFLLNYELHGWMTGSLILVVVHLLWGRWTRLDTFWALFCVGAVGMYSLYWGNGGPDYGPRYWYSMIFPLLMLSMRGASTLCERLRAYGSTQTSERVGAVVGVMLIAGLCVFGSWRAVSKYVDYRTHIPGLTHLVEEGAFGEEGLVLVSAEGNDVYAALNLNDVVPGSSGVVFARDLDPDTNRRLIEAYPGRPVYRLDAHETPDGWVLDVSQVSRDDFGG